MVSVHGTVLDGCIFPGTGLCRFLKRLFSASLLSTHMLLALNPHFSLSPEEREITNLTIQPHYTISVTKVGFVFHLYSPSAKVPSAPSIPSLLLAKVY